MRRLLPVLSITATAVFMALALAPACSDQCRKEDDCASSEVCYAGVCEALTHANVRCASDLDCDPNMRAMCRAGRCERLNPAPAVASDSGVPDPDGGDAMTFPDAIGFPDAVALPDGGDASTSTSADGGDAGPGPGDEVINGTLDGLPITWTATTAMIQATLTVVGGVTNIEGTGMVPPLVGRRIQLLFPGSVVGAFDCATPGVAIEWADATGATFLAGTGQGNCTITVTTYGAVNGSITGSFTGTMQLVTPGNPPPVNETPVIIGNFDVIRDPDL